jgi:hypothetical protein
MDVHPRMENDNGGFPDADPPSDTEDDCGDKLSATETYYNNNGNYMKAIITMAMGLKKEKEDDAPIDFAKEPWATKVPKKTWKLSMSDLKEEISQRVGSPVQALVSEKVHRLVNCQPDYATWGCLIHPLHLMGICGAGQRSCCQGSSVCTGSKSPICCIVAR